jgi:hypothetical protein
MESASLRAVTKPELGFTVWVPEHWSEFEPQLSNSPYEVARFRYRDEGRHICLVFRPPPRPDATPRAYAEGARWTLERKGFAHFTFEDLTLDGRPAVRMDFDRTLDFGPWFVREYFLVQRDVAYVLGLGTSRPKPDGATFDNMASRFHLD